MADFVSARFAACSVKLLSESYRAFNESFGCAFWEHHPIFWRSLLRSVTNTPASHEDVQELYRAYLGEYSARITLYSDVLPFLKRHAADRRLALLANGNQERLYSLVAKYDLQQYFSAIVISGECPFQKPDAFPFLFALNQLCARPEQAVMIGDRYNTDVAGARAVGIRTIHLTRNEELPDSCGYPWTCPDAEVRTLEEITDLLSAECQHHLEPVPDCYRLDHFVVRDAVVVCGGRGRRMLQLTESQQKCMLPLGGVPIIDYILRALVAVGCRRVFFVLGYRSEDVVQFVGDGRRYGISAEYIRGDFRSTIEGTLASLSSIGEWFYYLHGNIIFSPRLLELLWLRFCSTRSSALVLSHSQEDIHHARVRIDDDGWLTSVDATGTAGVDRGLLFIGLAIYAKRLFTETDTLTGMTEVAVARAVEQGTKVSSLVIPSRWRHYESPQEYELDSGRTPSQIVGW